MPIDKTCSMREAVGAIAPGSTVGLGGLTLYRRPVAAVREIIRQRIGDLTLLGITLGYESDLLVGAGLVSRVRASYFGLEVFGLAPMYTQAVARGQVAVVEETEASIVYGLRAAVSRVEFLPSRAWEHTDFPSIRPDVRTVVDPYSGETYMAFPAIVPDVAIAHAREADRMGNAVLGGNLAIDREVTLASRIAIVTAERIVERLSGEADVLGAQVTHVVAAPGGALPTSCYPDYPLAADEMLRYVAVCQADGFNEYLEGVVEA